MTSCAGPQGFIKSFLKLKKYFTPSDGDLVGVESMKDLLKNVFIKKFSHFSKLRHRDIIGLIKANLIQFLETMLKFFLTKRFLKSDVNKYFVKMTNIQMIMQNYQLIKKYCLINEKEIVYVDFSYQPKDIQANTKRNIRIAANLLNVLNILNMLQIKHIDKYYKTEEKIRLT